ncbi:MAG: hypothetical protein SFV32_06465 [Opitutaceae bacterium]|nr:hypothetical protein [Opitutaceae bacterium]
MTSPAQTSPRTGLLPSPYFFVRVLEVGADATPQSVAEQVELAVENWAPFPLNQVFFGHHWKPGGRRAVVFAAYRRRFTDEMLSDWQTADWVAPEFAPYLGLPAQAGQTLALTTIHGVAVIHWSEGNELPTRIVTRPFPEDADDAAKAAVAEEAIKAVGGTVHLLEASGIPNWASEPGASEWEFAIGDQKVSYSRAELDRMDVRDRGDLAALRKGRARDQLLWRVFVASLIFILGAAIAHGAFFGLMRWEQGREARLAKRAPEIESINRSNELATRIEELATRKLLPFEMIDAVRQNKPASIVFRSVTAQAPGRIEINASTPVAADLPQYRSVLVANPKVAQAEFLDQNSRDRVTSFRLQVTFKPNAFDQGGAQ